MLKRVIFLMCIMLLALCNISSAEEDPILAKAGDYVFRKSSLNRLLSLTSPQFEDQLKKNPEQKVAIVRKIMEQKIIADKAKKEGFDNDEDIREQFQYLVNEFLSREYLLKKVIKTITLSEDDLRAYYKENEKDFTVPEQVKVRHILIKTSFGVSKEEKKKAKDKAAQILEWLKKGEKFEILAEQYSEDPKSKAKGGDLGYISKGQMPKPFEDRAFSMKSGQISDAVETDYGYHIIQVDDNRPAKIKTFDEVKDSIKNQLTDKKINSTLDEFIKQATKDAGMIIFTDSIVGK